MSAIFNEGLFRPIFNLLVFLYDKTGGDLGVAIILLTLIVRLVFFPLSIKALASQRKMSELQPKLKEIQNKHKNDKAKQTQEIMELYKTTGANPLSGCLPLLIQLPVLFALYKAFIGGLDPKNLNLLYSFIPNPGALGNIAFGFLDLGLRSITLAVLAGLFQFVQGYLSYNMQRGDKPASGPEGSALAMSRQMLYFMPVMIILISWKLPAGLVLYWAVTTLFSVVEQLYIKRFHYNPVRN